MKYGKFIDAEGELALELSFLAKAVSPKDEGITFLRQHQTQYIHIEPSDTGDGLLGVATNGRQLSIVDPLDKEIVKLFEITTGYWQVFNSNSKRHLWMARIEDSETEEWTFPSWRKVVPTGEATYKTKFAGFKFTGVDRNYNGLAQFIHDFPEVTAINLDYLQSLGMGYRWDVEWFGPSSAIKFTKHNFMAVIMPMQIVTGEIL